MTSSFLPYAKQSINEADIQAVAESLKEKSITRGPLVQHFEEAIAEYCQVPYAVAFNSGTSALMAAYFAAGFTAFDRVISTPNTFIATVGAALSIGSRPRWIDIDRATGNLDLTQLNSHLNLHSTRGRPFIVPVHFSGLAVDMAKLDQSITHPGAIVIEDAAHALGSFYPSGQKVGSCVFSHMTVFSFHPAKIITTGEGGIVTTRDPELFHRLQLFRNNGIENSVPYLNQPAHPGYYEVHAITGNFNFTSFQAALGLSQLKRIDDFIVKRRQLVSLYRQRLKEIPHLTFFTDQQDTYTAFHLFVVQIDFQAYSISREKMMHTLNQRGIGTQVHYIPLYHHPVLYRQSASEKLEHPNTEIYYQQALSLPLYADLTESDVHRICDECITILN